MDIYRILVEDLCIEFISYPLYGYSNIIQKTFIKAQFDHRESLVNSKILNVTHVPSMTSAIANMT